MQGIWDLQFKGTKKDIDKLYSIACDEDHKWLFDNYLKKGYERFIKQNYNDNEIIEQEAFEQNSRQVGDVVRSIKNLFIQVPEIEWQYVEETFDTCILTYFSPHNSNEIILTEKSLE